MLKLMNRAASGSVCVLVLLCFFHRAAADQVVLYDGKKLDGNIQSINKDTLTLQIGNQTRQLNLFDVTSYRFVNASLPPQVSQLLINGEKPSYSSGPLTAKVKLRKGYHRFTLPFYHTLGIAKLDVKMTGPGISNAEIPKEMLARVTEPIRKIPTREYRVDQEGYRLPVKVEKPEQYVAYRLLEWKKPEDVKSILDLISLPVKKYGASPRLALISKRSAIHFGLIYEGLINIPRDGEYTFSVKTDKNSKAKFYLGAFPSELYKNAKQAKGKQTFGWQILFSQKGKLNGEIEQWSKDSLDFNLSVGAQQVQVPLKPEFVHEVWKIPSGFNEPASPDRKGESKTEDTAYIRTNDGKTHRVSGEVLGMNQESLTFLYQGEKREVNRDRVVGLVLHKNREQQKASLELKSLVSLTGGSLIPGEITSDQDGNVTILLAGGTEASLPKEVLESVKTINARSLSLTEMIPESVTQVPFFNQVFPYQVNRSFTGKPLKVGEQTFSQGLCVHSKTVLVYQLDGQFNQFNVTPGLQSETGDLGNVNVSISADGKTLFENQEFSRTTKQSQLQLNVNGCQTLTLTVDFGKNQDVGDRFVWGAPQLIRAAPKGLAVSEIQE